MAYTLYGDGIHDDYPAIQEMLDSGASLVYLPTPKAFYVISKSLKIHSNQEFRLDRYTRIRLAKMSNCVMMTNADPIERNKNITISGGIWDMNHNEQWPNSAHFPNPETGLKYFEACDALGITREEKKFADVYLGNCFVFAGIDNFYFGNLTIENPVVYGINIAWVEHFTIENITFDYTEGSPKLWNMDGVHVDGGCKHGYIHNLHGACHDDMVALTTDDLLYGPIEDVTVDGVYADGSHSAVRLLTAQRLLRNIHITNIYGTYYVYCITLSKYNQKMTTRGWYENITIDNVYASLCEGTVDVKGNWSPLISVDKEVDVSNLSISNVYRKETHCAKPTIGIYPDTVIKNMTISNVEQVNQTDEPITLLENNGRIKNLKLYNVESNGDTLISGEDNIDNLDIF